MNNRNTYPTQATALSPVQVIQQVVSSSLLLMALLFFASVNLKAQSSLEHEFLSGADDGFGFIIGEANNELYMVAYGTDDADQELFKMDASGNITQVTNHFPSYVSSVLMRNFYVEGDYIYFSSRYNGASSLGFTRLNTVTDSVDIFDMSLRDPDDWFTHNGMVYFISSKSGVGRQLWKVDPASGNISQVTTANSPYGIMTSSGHSIVIGDTMYTSGYLGTYTTWSGTYIDNQEFIAVDLNSGSVRSYDLYTGKPAGKDYSNSSTPKHFYESDGKIYFAATYPVGGNNHRQLFVYNPATGAAPTRLTSFTHNHSGDNGVAYPMAAGDNIYFRTEVSTPRIGDLYAYNKTSGSVTALTNYGVASTSPTPFMNYGGSLYFIAYDGTVTDFFKINPSNNNITPVGLTDLYWGSIYDTVWVGDDMYWGATSNTAGDELLKYNRSTETLSVAADIVPGSDDSWAGGLYRFNGDIYFGAYTVAEGFELYKYELGGTPPAPSNNAPVFADTTLSIDENSSNNTVVGAFGATDADTDPLTYTILSGNTGAAFKVSGGNLAVNDGSQLDHETTSSYSLQVKVSDGTDSATATITVNVNDVNEAPVISNATLNIDEDENSQLGGVVYIDMYADVDGDTLRQFKVLSLPTAGHLEINGVANVNVNTDYTLSDLDVFNYVPNANTFGTDSFILNVSDGQLYASAPATLTINILPVNDPPVIRDVQSIHQEDVTDNMLTGFTPADFSDVEGDTITWVKVVTLPTHGTLRQNGTPINAGDVLSKADVLTATYTPDANYFGSDNFVYNMSDGTDYAVQNASINIMVTPVSDAPTDISLSDTAINENEANGTVIGTLSATDIDPADSHTFQVNNGAFSVVGNQLVSNTVFNYEVQTAYTIDITAMDQAGDTYTKTFTIAINDQNDAPTAITLSNNTISESTTINSMVGILTAADEDAMYTHTYSLVSGNGDDDNNAFVINNNILQTNTTFNYNTQQAYSIRVRVTDDQNGTYEEVFVINITDQNTAPTDLTLSANTVLENESAGTIVGSITATDADQAETFTYTLVSGAGDSDNASFSIVDDKLYTAASFDFETKSSYSIRVKVEDGSANTYEEAFTIQVQDVNEAPTQVSLSNNTVAENLPSGTLVGTLSTTDVDANDTHTYVLSSGNGATGNASFAINGDQLVTNAVLDFETQDTYTVKVKSTDAAGHSVEQQFTINVADANDAPTGVTLDVLTIDENSPVGATVGTLSATDLDPAGSHTFTLVSGVGSADNSSFTIVNNKLQVNAGYDFETKSSYRVRVRATDQGNAWTEETFTITINDVNETPDAVNAQTVTIDENLPAGTVVATLSTVDVDNGDSHSYDLATGTGDADNGLFAINGNQVVTTGALNYESQSVYSIRVEATDQGGLKKATVVAINIVDANDAPVAANMHKSVNRNNSLSFFSRELLSSWSDEDGDAMVTVRIQHVPAYGKLYNKTQLLADGDVISVADITVLKYVPNTNFAGNDSFTYQVSDGTDYGNVATVNITVNLGRVAGPSVSNVGHHNFSGFVNNRLAGETGIEEVSAENATLGNYPNPFYGSTKIAYTLPAEYTVSIKVYDLLGKEVQILVNDVQSTGDHAITWNGTDMNGQQLTSGKYICQMVLTDASGETVSVKTISLMKVK